MEAPVKSSLPEDGARSLLVLKPELDNYIYLNFVNSETTYDASATKNGLEKIESTASNEPPVSVLKVEGIMDMTEEKGGCGDDNNAVSDTETWRGSTFRRKSASSPKKSGSVLEEEGWVEHRGQNPTKDESHLYPRTLGSSVSVLDEKAAVARTGGPRFVGEDPIHGRLRATDPFQWMGRLHAGAAAISSLIDTTNTALEELERTSGSKSNEHESSGSIPSVSSDITERHHRGRESPKPGEVGFGESQVAEDQNVVQSKTKVTGEARTRGLEDEQSEGDIEAKRGDKGTVEDLGETMNGYSKAMENIGLIRTQVIMEEDEEGDEDQSGEAFDKKSNGEVSTEGSV